MIGQSQSNSQDDQPDMLKITYSNRRNDKCEDPSLDQIKSELSDVNRIISSLETSISLLGSQIVEAEKTSLDWETSLKETTMQRQLDALYRKLQSLRVEKNLLRDEKNLLRDEENKLRDKKNLVIQKMYSGVPEPASKLC